MAQRSRTVKGKVTADGKLVVGADDLTPGEVDVTLVYLEQPEADRRGTEDSGHPAFGIWADRAELTDSAAYARELRRQVESRGDRRG